MNSWSRLIGRFLFILAWLFFISLPIFAFWLATRQQIQIGNDEQSHLRFFLLQEKDTEGIGLELAVPFSTAPQCLKTSVHYLMWTGASENVTYCRCLDPQTNDSLRASTTACNPP